MFNPGDQVAWTMLDGNTMAGKILIAWADALTVLRVDGTTCRVPLSVVRPATLEDREAAGRFFTTSGAR